jgi:uncharacterized protein YkwD
VSTWRSLSLLVVFFACHADSTLPPAENAINVARSTLARPAWSDATLTKASPGNGLCGTLDAALGIAAVRLAELQLGAKKVATREVQLALRSAGSPYVWPRMWTGTSSDLDQIRNELPQTKTLWSERCGIGEAKSADGSRAAIVILHANAKATLEPIARTAAIGEAIPVAAEVAFPAKSAKVYVLPPEGAPQALPTSFNGKRVAATFRATSPGAFTIQVVAEGEGGPAPILEAIVFAGVAPSDEIAFPTKGARAGTTALDGLPEDQLYSLVNASRQAARLPALVRARDLEAVARAHSEAMVREQNLAHILNGKSPEERVRAAGIQLKALGENVAFSNSVEDAHDNLMASPSHRGNIVAPMFREVGIAVVTDQNNHVWVTEVFGAR